MRSAPSPDRLTASDLLLYSRHPHWQLRPTEDVYVRTIGALINQRAHSSKLSFAVPAIGSYISLL